MRGASPRRDPGTRAVRFLALRTEPSVVTADYPTRDEIATGMTVTIVQEAENNPGEPLVGDVRRIITEEHTHPGGILVELESGATGRVQAIGPEGVEE